MYPNIGESSMHIRLKIIALLGILLEWAEYSLFLYLGPLLAPIFFPNEGKLNATLMVFLIFATGYLFRPLGGAFFGYLSDKFSRSKPMIYCILMMGIATCAIGLLPSYTQIGIASPLLLLLLRIIQNISISGEYKNACTYLMEHASGSRKTFYGALVGAMASLGMVCGGSFALLVLAFGEEIHLLWRIPFIVTGCLSILLAFFRSYLPEPEEFDRLKRNHALSKNPLLETFKHYKTNLLLIFILGGYLSIYVYICSGYYATYLRTVSTFSVTTATYLIIGSQLLITLLMPVLALLCKSISLNKLFPTGVFILIVIAPLQFYLAGSHNIILLSCILATYAIGNSLASIAIIRFNYDSVITQVRCTNISIAYNCAVALFGGTAPMIAELLVSHAHPIAPGVYVGLAGLVTLFLFSKLKPKLTPLTDTQATHP